MEYKIVSSSSPEGLSVIVTNNINEGWTPVGSHQVVVLHSQNRFSGSQHMDTKHETEYSQTMVRKTNITEKDIPKRSDVIEVDISFYHPEDKNGNVDETIKVYDVEGMREEFEYELNHLLNND
jgi:hypothetical protein